MWTAPDSCCFLNLSKLASKSSTKMPINKGPSKPVLEIKTSAEDCMKKGNYHEAFLQWTRAIKMVDGTEPTFYDQRCKCFIETGQFSLAMEDAQHLIDMWFHSVDCKAALMGHVRKAQIFFASQNYAEAIEEFQISFRMSADPKEKASFFESASKAKKELGRQRTLDAQYPFVGAAVGILVAVAVVVYDYVANAPGQSYIGHPLLKVVVVIAVSGSCFGVANFMRDQVVAGRRTMLEPPPDIFGEISAPSENHRSHKDEKSD